jgi:hypothetical protein
MEEAKQQEGWWPLTHENAPIALVECEQRCGNDNGAKGRPIPSFFRNLVGYTEVLILYI